MKKERYKLTEGHLSGIIKTAINEFLSRDTISAMKSLGINDPSDKYVVNKQEIKQKCSEFLQKCYAFREYLDEFDRYLNWVEEEAEEGEGQAEKQTYPAGVRTTMRSRNMFGARDLSDEYLEEELNDLDSAVLELKNALETAQESAEILS